MPLTDTIKAQQEKLTNKFSAIYKDKHHDVTDLDWQDLEAFITDTARAAYQQALEDVRAGVDKEIPVYYKSTMKDEPSMASYVKRTTVLEHLDLLGKE